MNPALRLSVGVVLFPLLAFAGQGKLDQHLSDALANAPDPVPVIVTTNGDPGLVAARARLLGAEIGWVYDIIDGFSARVPSVALSALASDPGVERIHLDREVIPLMNVSHKAIEADRVWAAGTTGAGVTVAVLDTGIDSLHPFFTGAIARCVSTIGGLVTPECTDSDGHGTHVSGSVASRDATYPGIAKGAKLAVVRVLHAAGAGLSSDLIAGMNWVKNNKNLVSPAIRVATMSIGPLDPGCGNDSSPEAQAANALVNSGVPFTVAAGNSGPNGCTIDGAGAASKVITVAAVDDKNTVTQSDDVIASFSSRGGNGLVKPDVSFPGVKIRSAFLAFTTNELSGTSMATPHAAGVAALLIQKKPALTAPQVKSCMLKNALPKGSPIPNIDYGWGLGNAWRAFNDTAGASDCPLP